MRIVLQASRDTGGAWGGIVVAYLAVVGAIVLLCGAWLLCLDPVWAGRTDLPFHLVLLGVLAGACALWALAVARRRVGAGTGAGFLVSGLALATRAFTDFCVAYLASGSPSLAYGTQARMPIWLHRNVGLAAWSFGLAVVALSCAADLRARRDAPAWLKPSI